MQYFIKALRFVQQRLYGFQRRHYSEPRLRVVCLADTHSQRVTVPSGDILIHAGDLSRTGLLEEIQDTVSWLNSLPHKFKIVIAGNADLALDPNIGNQQKAVDWGDVIYLRKATTNVEIEAKDGGRRALVVYGDPHVPRCGEDGQEAFQYEVDEDYWRDTIPAGTDILVTHTPPKFIRDEWNESPEGSPSLLQEVERVRPKLHVFGHVHPAYGQERVSWSRLRYESFAFRRMHHITDQYGLFSPKNAIFLGIRLGMALLASLYAAAAGMFGPGQSGTTLFVNGACASPDSSYMKNSPHVVYI